MMSTRKEPATPLVRATKVAPPTPSTSSPKALDTDFNATSSIKKQNKRRSDQGLPENNTEIKAEDLKLEIKGVGLSAKPPYSYATLIGMSILTSESKRLTLAEIYGWISDNFKYYKKGDVGWQNSIRHNLSLNKAFTKSEKSKSRKGHYWQIEPGMEPMFLKVKTVKKSTYKKKASLKQEPKKDYFNTYQQLTPSSSMIHDEEDKLPALKEEDATDPATDSVTSQSDKQEGEEEIEHQQILDHYASPKIMQTPQRLKFKLQKDDYAKRLYEETEGDSSEDDFEKENIAIYKSKKQKTLIPKNYLGNIPLLEAPISSWSMSVSGENTVFEGSATKSAAPFMSSFNSSLNFDLSPIRRGVTGPILEPITPGTKNPTTQSTPNRLKTPSSASIMRKIWNSPSYLDDFYTSPSAKPKDDNSKSGSPKKRLRLKPHYLESSIIGNINTSYNDFFGVDICSVVKRAVESAVEETDETESKAT